MASILPYVCYVEVTESLYVSLFRSLLSYSYNTNKPSYGWLYIFSSSVTSSKISSISSTSEFSSFESSSSLYVMSSIMGILGDHSNMVYWSKVGCFYFFYSSSALFKTLSSISSSIQSSLWVYFLVYKYMNKRPPYYFDYLNSMLGMLLHLMLFIVPVYTME